MTKTGAASALTTAPPMLMQHDMHSLLAAAADALSLVVHSNLHLLLLLAAVTFLGYQTPDCPFPSLCLPSTYVTHVCG